VDSDEDADADEEDDEDNSDLENAYLGKKRVTVKPTAPLENSDEDEPNEASESDAESDDDDAPPPVHESLTKRVRTKPAKKSKIVPDGETPSQRDARTLFVGGLPVDVAQKKVRRFLTGSDFSFLF
jgi:nucleolar protein 12